MEEKLLIIKPFFIPRGFTLQEVEFIQTVLKKNFGLRTSPLRKRGALPWSGISPPGLDWKKKAGSMNYLHTCTTGD